MPESTDLLRVVLMNLSSTLRTVSGLRQNMALLQALTQDQVTASNQLTSCLHSCTSKHVQHVIAPLNKMITAANDLVRFSGGRGIDLQLYIKEEVSMVAAA